MEKGELPSFINKVIEWPEREFVARIINQAFQSHDLGSLQDLMTKHGLGNPEALAELHDRIRIFLGIKENHFNPADEKSVQTIIRYLQELDVLYHIPQTDEYIFTQPGMRYSQATDIAEALISSDVFVGFSVTERHRILEKLESDICGHMLEDIVFYEFSRYADRVRNSGRSVQVSKYRDVVGNEIDILVTDIDRQITFAVEVKLSELREDKQQRHLLNQELCQEIENELGTKIVSKAVVYRGCNSNTEEKGILYFNVEELLCNIEEILSRV